MKYTALIPVKSLQEAKTRLASYLTPDQRAQLMLHMLQHVITTLHESALFSQVSVVSPDPHVLHQTYLWGAQPRVEEVAGHNPALTRAAQREIADGSTALLTISADLPMLQTHNLASMVQQLQQHDVVMASSQDGTGTNAILMRPPLALPYVFGVNSLTHYRHEAERHKLSYNIYQSFGSGLDVDTIEDLEMLQDVEILQHHHKTRSVTMLTLCR